MILKTLRITLAEFGNEKGQYRGTAEFAGKLGVVTLYLSKDHVDEIFRTCAQSLIETSKEAARHLSMSVIEHAESKAIEVKGGKA